MLEKEGSGWRLARDSSRKNFPVLIGGKYWAIELTENEWIDLLQLVIDLVDEHKKLQNQLMKEETVSLELERHPWWACIDGDRKEWSLHLILEGDGIHKRGVEAYWPTPSAQYVTNEMRTIWDSLN